MLRCDQATILFWNNFLSALKTVQLKPTLSSYEKKEKTGLDLKSKLLNRTWCIWKRKPFMERTRFFSQEDEYNFSASYTRGPRIMRILELPVTASILLARLLLASGPFQQTLAITFLLLRVFIPKVNFSVCLKGYFRFFWNFCDYFRKFWKIHKKTFKKIWFGKFWKV